MEVKISKIIQGCMTMGAWGKQLDQAGYINRIKHCFDAGITTFDHADIYGDYTTEREFGGAFAKADIPRDHVQFISKCGIQYVGASRPENVVKHYRYDAAYIIWSAEKSLKDLQTDYLDILLLHRPSPLMHAEEVAQAIAQLQRDGKVRAFGVSNFTPAQTALIQSAVPVHYNQIEYSITAHQCMTDGSLDYMQTQGITPMSWSPLGGVFRNDSDQARRINKALETLCPKYNATADQLLLAWILKHPSGVHPVIGTTTPERITGAVAALDIKLELQDWFVLYEASMGQKVA